MCGNHINKHKKLMHQISNRKQICEQCNATLAQQLTISKKSPISTKSTNVRISQFTMLIETIK